MAQRRMFSLSVVNTDAFLDLPLSSQALYFHLGMRADDDGFLGNVKTVQRTVGASADDLKLLIAKGFLIEFESGVCVVRDWDTNNYIRNDRYHETRYLEEKSMLSRANGYYALSPCPQAGSGAVAPMDTACIPPGSQAVYQNADLVYQRYTNGIQAGSGAVAPMDTEVRLDKDSLRQSIPTPPPYPDRDRAAAWAAGYDPAYGEVMSALLDFIPEASEIARGEMTAYYQELGREICLRAIWTARDERKGGFSYIRGILRRCQKEGIRTLADWDRAAREKEARSETPRARDEPEREAPSHGFKCLSE